MKMKFWSPVLAGAVIALSAASALGQSPSPSVKVTCETSNGIPTTMLTGSEGRNQAFFHWRASALPNMDPQQLCEDVSKKLQSYYNQSSKNPLIHVNVQGIPKVCLDKDSPSCSQVLFTLDRSLSQTKSQEILDSILDPKVRQDAPPPDPDGVERGDQPRVYRVRLWEILFPNLTR